MMILAALFVLDLLLVWAIIVTKRAAWPFIIAAILAVCFVNFQVIGAFNSGSGWPVKADPAPGLFLGCVVQAPTAIYILDQPTKQQHPRVGYVSPVGAPRLYQVAYSSDLEAQCNKAQKAGAQGVPMVVGKKTGKKGKRGNSVLTRHFQFYPLPSGQLGQKP